MHLREPMETIKKTATEITVRISLTFQEAPDVHTLLAMTPVRQRGKLIRLALERYISETGHVSGSVETQIAVISEWLRTRSKLAGLPQQPQSKSSTLQQSSSGLPRLQIDPPLTPTPAIQTCSELEQAVCRTEVCGRPDRSDVPTAVQRWLGA